MFKNIRIENSKYCHQNAMYIMLVVLQRLDFCYLQRFTNISSMHGTFSLSVNVHMQNIRIQTILLRKI